MNLTHFPIPDVVAHLPHLPLFLAEDTQRDLREALPALQEAVACLKQLNKDDLVSLRVMRAPPAGVRLTMEAACVMFGLRPAVPTSTQRAKALATSSAESSGPPADSGLLSPTAVASRSRHTGEDNGYWQLAKSTLLVDAKEFLQRMLDFDKDSIDQKLASTIQVRTQD